MKNKEDRLFNVEFDKRYILNSKLPFDVIGFMVYLEATPEDHVISNDYLLERGLKPENLKLVQHLFTELGVFHEVHDEHETVN